MYQSGMKIKRIAKEMNMSLGHIYIALGKEGIEPDRKKNARKEQIRLQALMIKDQKAGMTVKEISKKYKKPYGSCANIIYNV